MLGLFRPFLTAYLVPHMLPPPILRPNGLTIWHYQLEVAQPKTPVYTDSRDTAIALFCSTRETQILDMLDDFYDSWKRDESILTYQSMEGMLKPTALPVCCM